MNQASPPVLDLPDGLYFDPLRGIVVEGIVARQMAGHPVGPRPNRTSLTCTFNELAGNRALTIFLAEVDPGTRKCGHRHLDETVGYVVAGRGHSEFRQADGSELTRVEWQAGDLLATPMNAWHEHFNSDGSTARLLSFKNAAALGRILGPSEGNNTAQWRLQNRYDDEPDYFQRRLELPDGRVRAGLVRSIVDESLPDEDSAFGSGVRLRHYEMGGHRMLDIVLVGIAPNGATRAARPPAEEALLILSGSGRTDIWTDAGERGSVEWSAGDLISPPLGIWRRHVNTGATDVRYLGVRNIVVPLGLGVPDPLAVDAELPARFPAVIDAQRRPLSAPAEGGW